MAAEINSSDGKRKPVLISKLEGSTGLVHAAVIIAKEDGVISVSEDKTVRVWLKRDNGQYWPSICRSMPAPCTTLSYSAESRRLFVGLTNGTICEFLLSEDYNTMSHRRDYIAHLHHVSSLHFSLPLEWVVSCGRDKAVTWHCSETGLNLGSHPLTAWATALEFDEQTRHVFVGDYSGSIVVLSLTASAASSPCKAKLVSTLKAHSGSVRCLLWDPLAKVLYSGSFDQSVIVWDIGGQQGVAYELQGHKSKVTSLCLASGSRRLVSGGEDGVLVVWNMSHARAETPEWSESDICQICDDPFFWNLKCMWSQRTLGHRQHHCRKCGRAICHRCSQHRSTLPLLGFEYDVRVCDSCHGQITDDDKKPLAQFHDGRHNICWMHLDEVRGRLLTCGGDRVVKIWDVSSVLQPDRDV